MLKIDLHTHCNEDPTDNWIKHSAKELIDHAYNQGFDVLSITCHNKVVYSDNLREYAAKNNILLIPGAERDIEGRHVLLYNFTQEEIDQIKDFNDLRRIKKSHHLVIAPHPFYVYLNPLRPKQISLFSRLEKNIDLFDGIEFCHLYTKKVNKSNKKAESIAKKYNLPMVAGSDSHNLSHMGSNFSYVNSEKNTDSVIKAIKSKDIAIFTRPRKTSELGNIILFFTTSSLKHKIFNR
jgi:predicted metal-dependent phosphoesterase TrpH